MKKMNRKSTGSRRGAAVVETALMLPLLIITTFGAIDIAQYINAAQVISNASREGARITTRNSTESTIDVENAIQEYLAGTFPRLDKSELGRAVEIDVRRTGEFNDQISGGNLNSIESGDLLVVTVEFDFESVRWLPGPAYSKLSTKTYCRRE